MWIELEALEIFGHHGVLEHERRDGQPFLYDLRLDVGDAGADDRLEHALDYRAVVAAVRELSDARRFDLLEALAAAVADRLLELPHVRRVSVRVRKPQVGLPVARSAVTAEREAARPPGSSPPASPA
jgi:dihydroneopterin aldolase